MDTNTNTTMTKSARFAYAYPARRFRDGYAEKRFDARAARSAGHA
jgi:hypothetical protein